MNDQLLSELVSELHNINLNLIELTNAIKNNNSSNIDLESLFSDNISAYSICNDCTENNYGEFSNNQPVLSEGVNQV